MAGYELTTKGGDPVSRRFGLRPSVGLAVLVCPIACDGELLPVRMQGRPALTAFWWASVGANRPNTPQIGCGLQGASDNPLVLQKAGRRKAHVGSTGNRGHTGEAVWVPNQSIWATQAQIADLFQTDISNVSRHLRGIFDDGELDESSNLQKAQIAGSTKPVTFYSVDAIISVGYRVNSKAATKFRQWATGTIKAFVEQGYVINEKVLRESPEKLNRLAAQLRALRSEEKQVYAKVRECFKISSSDYDPSSCFVKRIDNFKNSL